MYFFYWIDHVINLCTEYDHQPVDLNGKVDNNEEI